KRRWVAEGIDTVVSVLIDMSGSMKGDSIKQSVDLGWTIAQAAETAGCDVEVLGFTSAYNRFGGASSGGTDLAGEYVANNTGSSDSATLVVAKRWQDKVANCAQYFNVMKRAAAGGTPDYSAIRTVAEQLSNHRAQRKLVIVITDGCGDVHEVKALTEAAYDLYGVDVIGFGIGISPDWFQRAYTVGSTVGWDLANLHKTCLKSVADQLSKRDMRRVA
ncbi:MAG: cobaltochelatase CobT-related protein, partial [Ilumatobacteraceae bacterium]